VDEAALESAVRRLGWRIYSTNQPVEQLSLEQAVLAYRSEYLVERSLGRLKGRPLSLTPMYVLNFCNLPKCCKVRFGQGQP
jgi:transposase